MRYKSSFIITLPLLIVLLSSFSYSEFNYKVENSNFTISQNNTYNYHRLRLELDYKKNNFFATIIGDGVNYYGKDFINSTQFSIFTTIKSDTPFDTQSDFTIHDKSANYAKLYRAYMGYDDMTNRIVAGLQNITMGVGRIWNPTNIFNPKNIYALEPDEVYGVLALSYTRYLSEISHIHAVISQRADKSYKYALRYKGYIGFADFALSLIHSNDTKMVGYELEGDLGDTGIELRSEGAYIQSDIHTLSGIEERELYQMIIGADYGFENGITLIAEALYTSKTFNQNEMLLNLGSEILPSMNLSKFYGALLLAYTFDLSWSGSLTYIESFNDSNSRFISPNLTYSINDYSSISLGGMIYGGNAESEFGNISNSYYFKYHLAF
ncbi:MAG: hypothetical protein U9N49_03405 [Campylobacterota bacterium]|nr:hypothetical protein [Campylobacterota bacterium]